MMLLELNSFLIILLNQNFLIALLKFMGLLISIVGTIKLVGIVPSNRKILELSSEIEKSGKSNIILENDNGTNLIVNKLTLKEHLKSRDNIIKGISLLVTGFMFQIIPAIKDIVNSIFNYWGLNIFFILSIFALFFNIAIIKKMEKRRIELLSEKTNYKRVR